MTQRPPTDLPELSVEAEDAFVATFHHAPDASIVNAIERAMEATRPQLAARLAGLLESDATAESDAVRRARSAARLVAIDRPAEPDPPPPTRQRRTGRVKERMRARRDTDNAFPGLADKPRRRR